MKKFTLMACLFMVSFLAVSQEKTKVVEIEGEAQLNWNQDKESKEDVKKQVEQLARINALQKAFGTIIIDGNSVYMKNQKTGEKVQTTSKFDRIGDIYVKGEIIEVTKLEFKEIESEQKIDKKKVKMVDIKCVLKANAREITDVQVNFDSSPLSGTMINNKTTSFYDGDSFFLYFKSPATGYLTVFIDDRTNAVRILPYQTMAAKYENGIPVEADKEYIFFNKANNYFPDGVVDELSLGAESQKDLNRVYIIFSKEPLSKPLLKENLTKDILTEKEIAKNYTVPKALPSKDFLNWLIQYQYRRNDVQKQVIDISIEKK